MADTETLRPDALGAETSIPYQHPDSTAHYDKVDEDSADNDTTYVYCGGTESYRDLYALPAHSVGSGTINSVKVYVTCRRSASGVAYCRPSLRSNTTVTDGDEQEITGSYAVYSQQWNTNPANGNWTWDDIDALQIGVVLRNDGSSSVRCTQVYVEIDYTPAAGWIGKICGVTNPAKIMGIPVANIVKVNGV